MFKVIKKSKKSQARLGKLKTAHGVLETPFFMPIATKAAVKNLTTAEIKELGSPILLSNTYHLYLTPGMEVMAKAGGLHKFMDWPGAILTDSGGFQVFSLSKIRKILPGGVEFRSHLDGSKHLLTPKKVLEIQKIIGSDIAMILDVCPPSTADHQTVSDAVEITTKWAKDAVKEIKKYRNGEIGKLRNKEIRKSQKQLHFAIVQGGVFKDLREKSLKDLSKLNFDGYAVGGLAVGETNQEMYEVLDYLAPQMPVDKPRYLMGVGTPENIVEAVKRGVDMFDCVIPTRNARHGSFFVRESRRKSINGNNFYRTINITNEKFKKDFFPVGKNCDCYTCRNFTRSYLRHLFSVGEPLAGRLATIHNLKFYLDLMKILRK